MSANNGVIRIGRKGIVKFAFGENGQPFEVDVVVAFQKWINTDEGFRPIQPDEDGVRSIPNSVMPDYHRAAVEFVTQLRKDGMKGGTPYDMDEITTAEALDFIARIREQYDELAVFFRPKLRREPDSPVTSGVEHRFSEEES